ncbi:MAG: hypothetical protein AAF830_00230 [Pseudomonadota bacterium]
MYAGAFALPAYLFSVLDGKPHVEALAHALLIGSFGFSASLLFGLSKRKDLSHATLVGSFLAGFVVYGLTVFGVWRFVFEEPVESSARLGVIAGLALVFGTWIKTLLFDRGGNNGVKSANTSMRRAD